MTLLSLIGFWVVLAAAAGTIVFSLKKIRSKYPPVFRKISPIGRLRHAIGLSVEDGSQMHVTLGNAELIDPANTSAIVGLSSLHRLGQLSSTSDQPPVCTSGNGSIALLSKDVLRAVTAETNARELYDPDNGLLTGATPFTYVMGTREVIQDPGVRANIFVGNFGPEVGFLSIAAEESGSFTLAASDSLTAQSIFMATTRDVLIGEELYAIPAYLAYNAVHVASLRVQDILRWVIGAALVVGAILRVVGIL